jgi:hypothetical protein
MPSGCKTMGTVLWYAEGCILIEFLSRGENDGAVCYLQTLHKLWCALRDRCPGKKKIIIRHNSAWPQTACLYMKMI